MSLILGKLLIVFGFKLCAWFCMAGCIFSISREGFGSFRNRARRLEIDTWKKKFSLIPEPYRLRSQRGLILYALLILGLLVVLLLFQYLVPDLVQVYGNRVTLLVAGCVMIPFTRQWWRCRRRSQQVLSSLGINPFGFSRADQLLFLGHLFFMWLSFVSGMALFGYPTEAVCGLALLVPFIVFPTCTQAEMSIHENGVCVGTRFYLWTEITWYRWYQDGSGILFGHNEWQFPAPVHYLPSEQVGSENLEQVLASCLDGKEWETVESVSSVLATSSLPENAKYRRSI